MSIHEKLTENLGVKLSDVQLRQLRGVAEAASTTPSELVRSLIEHHLQCELDKYRALHTIFADELTNIKDNGRQHG